MRIVIVLDCRQPERLAGFWAQVLGYRPAPSGGPYIVLVPDAQPGRDLVLQRVPEPKAGRTACTWTFASPPSNPSSRGLRPSAPPSSPPRPSTRTAFTRWCWLTRRETSSASAPNPSRIRDRTYVPDH